MVCKLSIILARRAPKAVILRRGPAKLVRLILWRTDTDEVEFGQWFKGRIYENFCDLSPDGSLFIYLAAKWNRFTMKDREYTYAWTAISKPPYLTALALWPAVEYYEYHSPKLIALLEDKDHSRERGSLLNGGGLFPDNKTVWLNHKPELAKPHPEHKPKGLRIIARPQEPGEMWRERISKNGWVIVQQVKGHWSGPNWVVELPWILEKRNKKLPNLTLAELSKHWSSFSVRNEDTGETQELEGADWAEWDQQGRLVFTKGCALFAVDAENDFANPKLISDFSNQTFEPMVAPECVTHW